MTFDLHIIEWAGLSEAQRAAALRRPAQKNASEQFESVRAIIAEVRAGDDQAILDFTARFDKVNLTSLRASEAEFAAAENTLTPTQKTAIERAIDNVRRFHEAQRLQPLRMEVSRGVVCEQIHRPIDAVGLYVPAGTAPLPSAAIMLAVPALIAGCTTRIICTPPRKDGSADPAVLAIAKRCGIDRVYKIGGAQAIAAMAYGTSTIPKVDKLYGPGNSWVTAAKILASNDVEGAALDLPAGPSEVLVIADDSARAEFVAADLLAQAEHSDDAQVVLVTTTTKIAEDVIAHLHLQMAQLSRGNTLNAAIKHARIIVATDIDTAIEISNAYAPEHLILQIREPRAAVPAIRNAGAIFLGPYTPETMGDYCSGANHVLPTYGFARAYSGLSLADFMKRMTVQELSADGLQDLGPTAVTIAELEGLDAHANAVTLRLKHMAARVAK